MKIKKKLTAIISGVLCLAMLMALPFGFSGLADPNGSLNPETCTGSEFDESVYDEVTTFGTILNLSTNDYEWPSSGTVLVKGSGINLSMSSLKGVVIPSGLVVDFYKYYRFGSDDNTYVLMAHYDTTDGKSITIGSSNSGTSSNSNSSSKPNNSSNSSTSSKDWGEVKKSFASGVKSDIYDNSYTDVPDTIWCYDAIMVLTEGGLLNGYGGGKGGPNDTLTRAQLAFIRTRLVGNEVYGNGDLLGYESYNDKATADRAFAAISLAGRLNTLGGGHSLTEYETSLVRNAGGLAYSISSNGQFGSMWQAVYDNWRASLDGGKDPSTYISSVDDLPDASAIHQWIEEHWELMGKILLIQEGKDAIVKACEDAVCRAYNLGMIAGVDSQGTFSPYAPLTRGQMATILWRAGWIEAGCLNYNI